MSLRPGRDFHERNATTFAIVISVYNCERSGGGAVASIGGALWIEHCVLSNNYTYYEEGVGEVRGGAISSADGYLRIEHSTGNTMPFGGGGLYNEPSGTVTLKYTAITRNRFTNGTPSDCDGTVISEGHNRFGVGSSGCTVVNARPSDQFEGL